MRARPVTSGLRYGWMALFGIVVALIVMMAAPETESEGSIRSIASALIPAPSTGAASTTSPLVPIALPDDWSVSRPRQGGTVRYRVEFDRPRGLDADQLLALLVERACSHLEVHLNGHVVHRAGPMTKPIAANCKHPQLVALPAALLAPSRNALDLFVSGEPLQHVSSRDFAGGLSALRIGPLETLSSEYRHRLFWNVTWVQATSVALVLLGVAMLALVWHNRHEVYFGYVGGVCLGWALLAQRLWIHDFPWPGIVTEYASCIGLSTIVVLGIQFLLSYAGLRSRAIETAMAVQWVLMPLTLLLAGSTRLFAVASLWYVLFSIELLAAAALYLSVTWRDRRHDFWPMASISVALASLLLIEMAAQHNLFRAFPFELPLSPLPILMPIFLLVVGARLFLMFARALRVSEAGRSALGRRVRELTTEFEGNFSQLAELRVEQVTEKERKRIAADLHDDLGAKLLTIVHTSESERISGLAREALEDMRLSVKGLIGKPMRLADALADWRAETVARLTQSKIEAEWEGPNEETEHLLPSHGFVQTTRILREAVSNIIKHSAATRCSVRCKIDDGAFAMTIQDNGRGIPVALDGKLDRGLGMSSMKRRAKQMRGQCLVQSGPGYGTVIALTVPL